ncbi:hypothetical protein O7606_27390 [Micromonospora sp. WMMD882]|uniref:hypothetical protein n=1 Tax=Micromonospora sp. WMMD882 TaxID=3015151 RepID=UPI00248C0771|nr:hypothetical protein [Micromonospora sp. WMMD882]WBB79805.1 hypothetical protein O7606_27390 [Micromonospora sp. WMMD882]
MTIRKVTGTLLVLGGGLGLLLAVFGVFAGVLALAPFGLIGLLLLAVGMTLVATAGASGRPGAHPRGRYAHSGHPGPHHAGAYHHGGGRHSTDGHGDWSWQEDSGHRGSSGHDTGHATDSGWSGGWSGGDSGGFSGGDSGGGSSGGGGD